MFFPFLTESTSPGIPMSTAVDRALQVEEILGTVFRHLSPYVWDRKAVLTLANRVNLNHGKDFSHLGVDALPCMENQTALVQCARVSRTIGPHALRVLWRTLPDIRPLLHLLNVMGFSYGDLASGTPFHTFPSTIELPPGEWKWRRYRWYASCVIGVRSAIDYEALEAWSDLGGPPLLPKLQSARFRIDPRSYNRTLRLLTSSIRDLSINFDSTSSRHWEASRYTTTDVLTAAARLAPAVEMLNITFRVPPKDLCPVLPRFSHLRILVVTGWMTPSLHEAIELLEHLEVLYVKLYWTRNAEPSMRNLPTRRCHMVKTLVVLTLSEPITWALQSTEFPLVETVRLEVWPHSSDATDMLTHVMATLRDNAPKMRTLTLTTRSAFTHGDRPPPRLVTVIEPLLQHSMLETLSITLKDNYAFALTRDDILSISSAWPNIVNLTLAHAPTRNDDALPPVTTFLELVNALPQLQTLVLCARFDCTGRDNWRDASIPAHPLRQLFLGLDTETGSYRPDKTWRALAAVLDRCFPNLELKHDLVQPEAVGTQAMETWQGVLYHLQDVRSGGRRSLSPPEF
ncbi:hypothetical protein C8Q73DRAFT_769653 [Cubamyces lactineus]|nr:hypothetical protein C8Q73DRAFT_769653 [Cubamyces lactineus]